MCWNRIGSCCSRHPPETSDWLLDAAEQAREKVIARLRVRTEAPFIGKVPILFFGSEDAYRQHTRHFSPTQEPGVSAGCCVRDQQTVHIAMPGTAGLPITLPHEMAHAFVADLDLPRWLDEGIAQSIARRALDSGFEFNWSSHARLFWRTRGLMRFWSGDAFSAPRVNEEIVYAYIFAETLAGEIRALGETDFHRFLTAAHRQDAGDAACRAVYGFGLQVWCQRLLGHGQWQPEPLNGGMAGAVHS